MGPDDGVVGREGRREALLRRVDDLVAWCIYGAPWPLRLALALMTFASIAVMVEWLPGIGTKY